MGPGVIVWAHPTPFTHLISGSIVHPPTKKTPGKNQPDIFGSQNWLFQVLMLNFPLICQPCRNALFRLLTGAGCVKAWAPVVEGDNGQEKLSLAVADFLQR